MSQGTPATKPLVCCRCGAPAVKGYSENGKRYCDPCFEDKLRRSALELHDYWDSRYGEVERPNYE